MEKLNQKALAVTVLLLACLLLVGIPTREQVALARGFHLSGEVHAQTKGQVRQGQSAQPQAPQAAVGSGFTYQGSLKDGGSPANGQYDLTFKLYNAASGSTQVGSTVTVNSQTVTEGLFTVLLDFGATAFNSEARWLEIAVRPTGSDTYTTLSPRQSLTPVPYAMSLATGNSGAIVNGSVSGPALAVNNTSGAGISGQSTGTNGFGLLGISNNGIQSAGVRGQSTNGYGVWGSSTNEHGGLFINSSTTGYAALQGIAHGTPGYGVYGEGNSVGVWGSTTNGTGVGGATTAGYGVHGYSFSTGTGVRGESTSASGGPGVHGSSVSGSSYGVYGVNTSNTGYGVYGVNNANNTFARGVVGLSNVGYGVTGLSSSGEGVRGQSSTGYGVHGESTQGDAVYGHSSSGWGVYGSSSSSWGVVGRSSTVGVSGIGTASDSIGVTGDGGTGEGGKGVYGTGQTGVYGIGSSSGVSAVGTGSSSSAIYASSSHGGIAGAGFFSGNIWVTGDVNGANGVYRIDHPADPENKYLSQSIVSSPDMLNIHNGNVTTDANGEAVVTLPGYFEALNKDFRYQLTVLGQFSQAIVSSKIKGNRFTIKTDKPNVEVSWQVTGVRQDPYAEANQIEAEEQKPSEERGTYLHPKAYNQPESKGVHYEMIQEARSDASQPQERKP